MLFPVLINVLEAAVVTVASSAAVRGVYDAVFGLVAKRKAQDLLNVKLDSDPAFKLRVSSAELQNVTDAISESLVDLSQRDRNFIERGLRQSSRQAELRYIENLIGSPSAIPPEKKS